MRSGATLPTEILFPAKQTFTLANYTDALLQPDEIRGRTLCTLISQGTEIGWANGETFPIRPGYAAVFEVTEVGTAVRGITPGMLRFAMGAHRATQTHLAQHTLPLPQGLDPQMAVVARLMGVSMSTLMTTQARPGDAVVITGAGPVGLLAAHLFRIGGYRVTLVDPDPLRRAQAGHSGLTDCRAAMPLEDPALRGQVALVVDCSGHEAAVREGCQMVRPRGEVDYHTRATLAQMQRFLLSVKEVENNLDIRQQRLHYLDQLIDHHCGSGNFEHHAKGNFSEWFLFCG